MKLDSLLTKARAHRRLPPPAARRAIREAAGLSQEDIARALAVDRASVARYEAGKRMPRGRLLLEYTALLEALRRV